MASRPTNRVTDDRLEQRLFQAIAENDINAVQNMIDEEGPSILNRELRHRTVLQEAVENGSEQMVQFLLREGVDVNEILWNGSTALHLAVRLQRADIARVLLDNGVNQQTKDLNGFVALEMAMSEDLPEMARVLITQGNNPLQTAAVATGCMKYAKENNMEEMIGTLNDLMESFENHDPTFSLYLAIIANNHSRVIDLLDQHVNPFELSLGKKKMSALHVGAKQSDVRILAMLLAQAKRLELVDRQDQYGQTPLHYAVSKDNVCNVDWLLFVGASVDIKDKNGKTPYDLSKSPEIIKQFETRWIRVPDGIILMRGDWNCDLPRAGCSLSSKDEQIQDSAIPPVLMFRCVTGDVEVNEKERYENSAIEADLVCLEVYEYRCTEPTSVYYTVDLSGRGIRMGKDMLLLKFEDREGDVIDGPTLQVDQVKMQAVCEVRLSTSGKFALLSSTEQRVARYPIGPKYSKIEMQNVPGFMLEIPDGSFQTPQEMLIKVEELRHQMPGKVELAGQQQHSFVQETTRHGQSSFPIINLSPFVSILNSEIEQMNKSLNLKIPMNISAVENDIFALRLNNFRNLIRSEFQATGANGKGKKKSEIEATLGTVAQGFESLTIKDEAWTSVGGAQIDANKNSVSTQVDDVGIMVAAEVRPGATEEDIIHAVSILFNRQKKEKISIYPMAKSCAVNKVEVIVCFVSTALFEEDLSRFTSQGYQQLQQSIVIYAGKREAFLIHINSKLKCFNRDIRLEYQMSGQQNHANFILGSGPTMKKADMTCAVEITRVIPHSTEVNSFSLMNLDLSGVFQNTKASLRRSKPSKTARTVKVDDVVQKLSETLSTDWMRVYCHALGLTKGDMDAICRGQSLSPTERNFRMLWETRCRYRSERGFMRHLFDTLTVHKEMDAIHWITKQMPDLLPKK